MELIRRRWRVAVGALMVALAVTAWTYISVPTQYQSNGVAIFLSPTAGGSVSDKTRPEDLVRTNPLLAFDPSLSITAGIIMQILRDPAIAEQLGAGPDSSDSYEVDFAKINGPFVSVQATSDSAQGSQALVQRVLDRASTELRDRQVAVGAPATTFIEPQVLVKPTVGEAKNSDRVRFTGAALLLGLFFSFTSVFAAESFSQSRRRGRQAGQAPEPVRRPTQFAGPIGPGPSPPYAMATSAPPPAYAMPPPAVQPAYAMAASAAGLSPASSAGPMDAGAGPAVAVASAPPAAGGGAASTPRRRPQPRGPRPVGDGAPSAVGLAPDPPAVNGDIDREQPPPSRDDE